MYLNGRLSMNNALSYTERVSSIAHILLIKLETVHNT